MQATNRVALNRVAVVGNYLPRKCGIATFTADFCENVASNLGDDAVFVVAVSDATGYDYPDRVRFEIHQDDLRSYNRAAEFLNINNVDLVCVQHEFGIYGGEAGSHLLRLLRQLQMPVVTVLHTVLREPDAAQREVMCELAQHSRQLVVMTERGETFLRDIYKISEDKINIVPHGIPDTPFVDPNYHKEHFGVVGRTVLLTFGLLSPGKGIETVVHALPKVVSRQPNFTYIVLGATHPNILRHDGDTYRESLKKLAEELGVADNVMFFDRFVQYEELVDFIGAADIYITPYLNQAQITSGTLAYAVGMGKAVISTPYWHAEELLADGRGILVPFGDSQAISDAILRLVECETERHAIRKSAYLLGRNMTWPKVTESYIDIFERARQRRLVPSRAAVVLPRTDQATWALPLLNLDHLGSLTDSTGLLQHAVYTLPNLDEGYCTDDNARALIAMALLEKSGEVEFADHRAFADRYLAFLFHAYNSETHRFRNFMSYERRWLEEEGSEDSHGRSVWALGTVLGRSNDSNLRGVAARLFDGALKPVRNFTSPRAFAFTLLGIQQYQLRFDGDRTVTALRDELTVRLLNLYRTSQDDDWRWFEHVLAYDNAMLPHALLVVGPGPHGQEATTAALESLRWLVGIQTSQDGWFVPIGSNGFYRKGGLRALFDQQPIEAHSTVSACLEAFRLTGDAFWRNEAQRAFDWFLGRNDLHLPLYDPTTGGCCDGLHPDRVNQNQGAESTLAFLLSLLEMRLPRNTVTLQHDQSNGMHLDGTSVRRAISQISE